MLAVLLLTLDIQLFRDRDKRVGSSSKSYVDYLNANLVQYHIAASLHFCDGKFLPQVVSADKE